MIKKYKIIDNALPRPLFENLQKTFFDDSMSWYYNDATVVGENDETYYFSHWLFQDHQIKSNHFQLVYDLFNKILDIKSILKIRANLTLRKEKTLHTAWHTDVDPYNLFDGQSVNFKTALFYLNTNNGSTLFDKKELNEVEAIANRLVVFDANVSHCNKYSTNTKDRIVINFNYV